MLLTIFPRLGNNFIIRLIRKIFASKHSTILIAVLTLSSNLFAWDIPILYAYAAVVALAALFLDDMRCTIPIACFAYFTFSKANNPLSWEHTSIFLGKAAKLHLYVVIGLIAFFAVAKLIFNVIVKKGKRNFPKLSLGFLALGISYVLGGLLSPHYDLKTVTFGLAQIGSLAFSYFYFYFTVDFEKMEKSYFAYLMTVMGFLLLGETLGMLYQSGFFENIQDFKRGDLYTGWGFYNNLAGSMIMCIPAPFYYTITNKKHRLCPLIIGNLFYLTMFFIQSRGGIVFGTCVYLLCLAICFWELENKRTFILTQCIFLACGVTVALLFRDKLYNLFLSMLERGFDDSGRFDIYKNGWKQFLDFPIFGNGFYACTAWQWGDASVGGFLPPRYHDTYVQLAASGGVFALLAYSFHRIETLRLLFKRNSIEGYFIALCILGLLLTSILDCHFFNFGPGFAYSALLLLMEIDLAKGNKPKKKKAPGKLPDAEFLDGMTFIWKKNG